MRHFRAIFLGALAALTTLAVGCTEGIDKQLGSDFLPGDHIMGVGEMELNGVDREGRSIVSTRLFNTQRLNAIQQSDVLMGLQHDEEFGLRRSGFFAQYTPSQYLDKDYLFGNLPFMDSMMIFLTLKSYSGDTTQVIKYDVYEVIDDSFLTKSPDSVYSASFDLFEAGALSKEPIFDFDYPDQKNGIYVNSKYVMSQNITKTGFALGDRLMLKDGKLGYNVYDGDYKAFVDNFKGLYIVPREKSIGQGEGATYSFDPAYSGFGFYGRCVYEEDPTIVSDTINMTYSFYDQYVEDVGGVSLQSVTHDYSDAVIDPSTIKNENNLDVPVTNRIRVEGMGGVVSEVTFEPALFEELDLALAEGGEEYDNLLFNVATLKVYVEMARGVDPLVESENFSKENIQKIKKYPTRLGLYKTLSTFENKDGRLELETAADYNHTSEWLSGAASSIGGMINRAQGFYQLQIPLQLQDMWNSYLKAKEAAGGNADAIDWDGASWNKLYLAPLVEKLFSVHYVTLQGGAGTDNMEGSETVAPMRLKVTYTLLKK